MWPPMWRTSKANPQPPSITTLRLQSIDFTGRTLVLDLGPLWFKLQYLTHTSVQMYRKSMWFDSICKVNQMDRGFKIGMAFEFDEFILAFPSEDMVFQPQWATTHGGLPKSPPDVVLENQRFLQAVATWISERVAGQTNRFRFACDVVRETTTVFGGVGVYTVVELFFLAGISPFLTEAEVFDCPSRTARLCEAMWVYANNARENIWPLLRSCMINDILAPTKKQRMEYARRVKVYGKLRTEMPMRMKALLAILAHLGSKGEVCSRTQLVGLHDIFEPTYLQPALARAGNLGHLIFGRMIWQDREEDSDSLGSKTGSTSADGNNKDIYILDNTAHTYGTDGADDLHCMHSIDDSGGSKSDGANDTETEDKDDTDNLHNTSNAGKGNNKGTQKACNDPLTQMFLARGLLGGKTRTYLQQYKPMFLDPKDMHGKGLVRWAPTHTYCSNKKDIWAVTELFPPNVVHGLAPRNGKEKNTTVTAWPLDDDERWRRTFDYKINHTLDVLVGPLEYCGNANIIRIAGGKKVVAWLSAVTIPLFIHTIVRSKCKDAIAWL
ncbi:hypothetical protein NM688_g9444 [Phlebia brevispora]|uniref:Uncharacterized protein n=1 Tax=Phlebia brevispora TaxID=194682 RepID=A0ACC1RH44_9APHY|nr:hypothetical protein NM688_g9444 [Phlebia brevispora]